MQYNPALEKKFKHGDLKSVSSGPLTNKILKIYLIPIACWNYTFENEIAISW